MKREILFRGKDIGGKRWFYGSYLKTDDNTNECFGGKNINIRHQIVQYEAGNWNLGGWAYYDVIPETIGQLTGLTDKNGVKIFEGDIVRITEEDEDSVTGNEFKHIGIVKYGGNGKFVSDYQASFILHCKTWYKEEGLLYAVRYVYEVIGNIHDNKELIK